MINTYIFNDNEILIEAPGSKNKNRIKNDLIWDVNDLLSSRYDLYTFFVCKTFPKSYYFLSINGFIKKYIVFDKLDSMFTQRTVLSKEELNYYRKLWDPSMKMKDDVFAESCCMENVDIEYIAINDVDQLLNSGKNFKNISDFYRNIISFVPIYISLFGSKEVRIVVNDSNLIKKIKDIVLMHCIEK